jgi:diguanylate cyclase (GGDEF)-like protein
VSRQVDCVARYGGEEFALVLADAGEEGARALLRRLRTAWDAQAPVTTFSAGVAVHDCGSTPHETLQRADVALYRAKEHGRDRDEFAAVGELLLP